MFPPNGSTPAPIAAWRRWRRTARMPSWLRWQPGQNWCGRRCESEFRNCKKEGLQVANQIFMRGFGAIGHSAMTIRFHTGDLPAELDLGPIVAIDTETLGLEVKRDRLCVVQLSRGDGSADVVQIGVGQTRAPRIETMLTDAN